MALNIIGIKLEIGIQLELALNINLPLTVLKFANSMKSLAMKMNVCMFGLKYKTYNNKPKAFNFLVKTVIALHHVLPVICFDMLHGFWFKYPKTNSQHT